MPIILATFNRTGPKFDGHYSRKYTPGVTLHLWKFISFELCRWGYFFVGAFCWRQRVDYNTIWYGWRKEFAGLKRLYFVLSSGFFIYLMRCFNLSKITHKFHNIKKSKLLISIAVKPMRILNIGQYYLFTKQYSISMAKTNKKCLKNCNTATGWKLQKVDWWDVRCTSVLSSRWKLRLRQN